MFDDEFLGRFWVKIVIPEDNNQCWIWKAATNSKGYGVIGLQGKLKLAHRVSFEIANGEIPEGMLILHQCDNRLCCNPSHLFLGTHLDNMADMVAKGRQASGEKNARSKLTIEAVKEMRSLYLNGNYSFKKLGEEFGISSTSTRGIIRGDYWKLPLAA